MKTNATQQKLSETPSMDYLHQNSVKSPISEMNHISPVRNRLSGTYKNEDIPMRPLTGMLQNGHEKIYNAIK